MTHPSNETHPTTASPPAIEVEGLTIGFFNYTVFENVSFSLDRGEFLAIIGPNGSGKTQLLKALLGLVRPRTGAVRLFGEALNALPSDTIGYVPQIKTLDRTFPATALALVVTGIRREWSWRPDRTETEAATAALERVGAGHLAGRMLGKLSGGELQRVYLARCLVRKPRLILLDEPATGVDVSLMLDLYQLLEELQRETGASLVMVTHDLATASYHADRALLINHRTVYFGDPPGITDEHLRQTFGHAGHAHQMRAHPHV